MPELFNGVWIHSETENANWNRDDKYTIDEVKSYQLPDFEVKTAIDIGANFGAFVLLLKKKYPNCEIVAIEPEPTNFQLLDQNTRRWLDVWPVQGYASEGEIGKLLINPEHSGCHKIVDYGYHDPYYQEGPVVGPYNLEMLFAILGLRKDMDLDLLKIDCEGCERELLLSARSDVLNKIRFITGEFHNGYSQFWNGIGDRLRSFGFEVLAIDDPTAHSVFTAKRINK